MIARIIPLRRLPRELSIFDYRLPSGMRLATGVVVRIPFRKRAAIGIVYGTRSRSAVPSERLLTVERVLSAVPLLPTPQLTAAASVSSEGLTSLATTVRSILPKLQLRESLTLRPLTTSEDDPELRAALDRAVGSNQRAVIIPYRSDQQKRALYHELVRHVLLRNGSAIVIAPTVAESDRLAFDLTPATIFHHQLGTTEFRKRFLDIRNRPSILVVGTRSAVFAPVQRLRLIIIDDEDADEHVQEEPSPRYDARAVATLLAKHTGAKVVLTSTFPSLTATNHFPIGRELDRPDPISITAVDLDHARRKGDFRILPEETRQRISAVLSTHGTVAIVHHRRVRYGSLECADCGFVPACPNCNVPLRDDGSKLLCGHCGTATNLPTRCPRCDSVRLRGRGRGIPQLEAELTELSGGAPTGTVTIVTPALLRSLPSERFNLGVITRYDSLRAVPRADADERARRTIATLTTKIRRDGRVIVQTSERYASLLRSLDDASWRTRELELREQFGYPPAWRLLLLRRRSQGRSRGISAPALVSRIRHTIPGVVVTGPFSSPGRSRADRGGNTVILRYRTKLPDPAQALLKDLDESWSITPDPLDLR